MHHKIIKSLIAEIRLLRQQISSVEQDEYEYRNSDFYERKCRFLKEENDRLLRQAEDERRERESREWERENLMKEFERRQSRGDEWGAERTMRKLKAL